MFSVTTDHCKARESNVQALYCSVAVPFNLRKCGTHSLPQYIGSMSDPLVTYRGQTSIRNHYCHEIGGARAGPR